jgi:hypothetical protein
MAGKKGFCRPLERRNGGTFEKSQVAELDTFSIDGIGGSAES